MIQVPTPIQHALVAQMLQGALPNRFMLQQGGKYLPEEPDPAAQGDWSYNQQWQNLPSVVTPGYGDPHGAAVMEQGVPQGHMAPPSPQSVFGRMRQSLPAATRSGIHSHQQALVHRFMRNMGGTKP